MMLTTLDNPVMTELWSSRNGRVYVIELILDCFIIKEIYLYTIDKRRALIRLSVV